MKRQVICALDTPSLEDAVAHVKRLGSHVGGFKIGHALVLNEGLDVINRLQDAGTQRIFLDLKFHDIPSVVGLAVREAAHRGVWMLTLHIAGGRAMMEAAVEELSDIPEEQRPCLLGVSVLTSLDERMLREDLGVQRSVSEHMEILSRLAMAEDLDGFVCSPKEVASLRQKLGIRPIIVTPGIRPAGSAKGDQSRVGEPKEAIAAGASYLVMGRSLVTHPDPARMLDEVFGNA